MNKLSHKMRLGLIALQSSRSLTEAARVAGVTDRTVYNWLRNPGFVAELRAQQEAAIEAAGRFMVAGLTESLETLQALLRAAKSERVRLAAAIAWLSHFPAIREVGDLESRISALERAVEVKR